MVLNTIGAIDFEAKQVFCNIHRGISDLVECVKKLNQGPPMALLEFCLKSILTNFGTPVHKFGLLRNTIGPFVDKLTQPTYQLYG